MNCHMITLYLVISTLIAETKQNFKSTYSRDPIKRAACLTIFQIFSIPALLIEPARLTILTKSSILITNHLSKYEYF